MKFKIKRELLAKGLAVVGRAIGSKSAIPLLMTVKMDIDKNGLTLTGSNNDLTIKTTIPTKVDNTELITNIEEGSTLINHKMITEMARKMESSEVSFEIIDETIAEISDTNTKYNLNSIKADEYPDIDLEPVGVVCKLPAKEFVSLVDQTAFAASTKEQRPILTALNLDVRERVLTASATDSARLAKKEVKLDSDGVFSANVPARTICDIARLLEGEDAIKLVVSEKKVLFLFGTTVVSSRLVGGEYPNTKNIVPKTFNHRLEINAKEFIAALERVAFLNDERANVVKLTMSEDEIAVSAKSAQVGSANAKISTFQYSGEPLQISFNCEFVTAAIRAIGTEDVFVGFVGEMKPFVVKDVNDDSLIQLVTPLRTY